MTHGLEHQVEVTAKVFAGGSEKLDSSHGLVSRQELKIGVLYKNPAPDASPVRTPEIGKALVVAV